MEIKNAEIIILAHGISHDRAGDVTIELHDSDASITFAKVTLTAEQWVSAMSRLGYTECKAEVFGVDRVGKTMRYKEFKFSLGKIDLIYSGRKELARKIVEVVCPEGWSPDTFFGGQDSFQYFVDVCSI